MSSNSKGSVACVNEIRLSLQAGPGGVDLIRRILPILYSYHGIDTKEGQTQVLKTCGLEPLDQTFPVLFKPAFKNHMEEHLPSPFSDGPRLKKKKRVTFKLDPTPNPELLLPPLSLSEDKGPRSRPPSPPSAGSAPAPPPLPPAAMDHA